MTTKKRELFFYKNYFKEFYAQQPQRVQIERANKIKKEYSQEKQNSD
jgi:hypothetical protein